MYSPGHHLSSEADQLVNRNSTSTLGRPLGCENPLEQLHLQTKFVQNVWMFLNFIIPKGWSCWNAARNPCVSGNANPAENLKVFQGIYIQMFFSYRIKGWAQDRTIMSYRHIKTYKTIHFINVRKWNHTKNLYANSLYLKIIFLPCTKKLPCFSLPAKPKNKRLKSLMFVYKFTPSGCDRLEVM